MPMDEGALRWIDEYHKGKPVIAGNRIDEFHGATKGYIKHTEWNRPTALNPDAQDIVTYIPSVIMGFSGGNMAYVFNMPKSVARGVYEQLRDIFEGSRTT